MTIRVTMTQTRMGEAGSLLIAGSTYTVSDEFGAWLIGRRFATDTDALQPESSQEQARISVSATRLAALVATSGLVPNAIYVVGADWFRATSASAYVSVGEAGGNPNAAIMGAISGGTTLAAATQYGHDIWAVSFGGVVTLAADLATGRRMLSFVPAAGQPDFTIAIAPGVTVLQEAGATLSSAEAVGRTVIVLFQADGVARVLSEGQQATGAKIRAAIVGDSHTGRHFDSSIPLTNTTTLGVWNWANALCGDPFDFQNFGWSGDTIAGICARAMAVPSSTKVVFINAGTNDVLALSTSASAGTVTAAVNASFALLSECVSALQARGQKVVITTIYPNNAYTPNTDARISYLNQLNAAILTLHNSRTVWAVDGFAALRDASNPTLGTAATDYLDAGGTHLTNLGAQVAGAACAATVAEVARLCVPDCAVHDGYHLAQGIFSALRTGTGGSAGLLSTGTGTIADGWRWLATTAVGTTVASVNAVASNPANYVRRAAPISVEKSQKFIVDPITTGGSYTFRVLNSLANGNVFEGVQGGSFIFVEFDVELVNPVLVSDLYAEANAYVTLGTAPADQGYSTLSGGAVVSRAMRSNVFATNVKSLGAYRGVIRSSPLRVPENISTVVVSCTPSLVVEVATGGRFELRVAAPRIWVRHTDRA